MRCISCAQGVGAKRYVKNNGNCPNCGHSFVAKPSDVITDLALKRAVERASSKDTLYFLVPHAVHELRRWYLGKRPGDRDWGKRAGWTIGVGVAVAFALGSVWIGLGASVAVFAGWPLFRKGRPGVSDLTRTLRQFFQINPPARLLADSDAVIEEAAGGQMNGLGAATGRVVVCQRERMVDLLIANRFHLEAACPVVGPDGYPDRLFPGLIEELRGHDSVDVFVLHDLSAAGIEFANDVKAGPAWFGMCQGANVVDVGINPEHAPKLGDLFQPLNEIPRAGAGNVPDVPEGMGMEFTVLRPDQLAKMLSTSID